MSKRAIVAVTAVAAVFAGVVFFSNNKNSTPDYSQYKISAIKELAESSSLAGLNPDTVFEVDENTGYPYQKRLLATQAKPRWFCMSMRTTLVHTVPNGAPPLIRW